MSSSIRAVHLVVFELESLVSATCNTCNGKGRIKLDDRSSPCSCIQRSYVSAVKRSVAEYPCPFCDRIGDFCEHRPADWHTYMMLIQKIALSPAPTEHTWCFPPA